MWKFVHAIQSKLFLLCSSSYFWKYWIQMPRVFNRTWESFNLRFLELQNRRILEFWNFYNWNIEFKWYSRIPSNIRRRFVYFCHDSFLLPARALCASPDYSCVDISGRNATKWRWRWISGCASPGPSERLGLVSVDAALMLQLLAISQCYAENREREKTTHDQRRLWLA